MSSSQPNLRRRFQGVVVSVSSPATAVVRVDRRLPHPKYGKYYTVSKRFMVDDPTGLAKLGAQAAFEECRPLSRRKRWRLVSTQ